MPPLQGASALGIQTSGHGKFAHSKVVVVFLSLPLLPHSSEPRTTDPGFLSLAANSIIAFGGVFSAAVIL